MCFNFAAPQGQLWPVLAVLATKTGNGGPEQDKDTMQDHGGNEEVGFAPAFWEVPYVQALQLSISSLKGAFNLQCKFEARWIKVQKSENLFDLFIIFHVFIWFKGCFNTPLEHTPGNPPSQLWKKSLFSLFVQV